MKNCLLLLALLLSVFAQAQENNYVPNRIVLSLKENIQVLPANLSQQRFGISTLDELNEKYHCREIHSLHKTTSTGGTYAINFDNAIDVAAVSEAYLQTGMVRYAEPDYTGTLGGTPPNDTWFARQWSFNNDGSFPYATANSGADINMLQAWDVEDGDTSVVIAIIDAGCKMDHPEFAGRIWRNYQEIPGDMIDNDNNGYVDDTLGWNTVVDSPDPSDDHGHGTNVTGIIGANGNNADGYSGVDQHCKLMICKAADATGFFAYTWLSEAIYYAVDNGANIINISAGGATYSNILQNAVDYANTHNVLVVAAMMNAGSNVKNYPAACNHVMAVGATGPTDVRAGFSNYGNHISVVAPGEYIFGLNHLSDTAYSGWMSGTSQATPHVAGLAALLLAQDPNRTPTQLRQLIESNAEDRVGDNKDSVGFDIYYGHGRINAHRTLTNAALSIKNTSTLSSADWHIYPNPAKDILYISGKHITGTGRVTISSMSGQILKRGTVDNNHTAISINDLGTGLYLVTVNDDTNHYTTKIYKD